LPIGKEIFRLRLRKRLGDKISEMTGGEERGGKRPKKAQKIVKTFAICPILQFQRPILQVLLTFKKIGV